MIISSLQSENVDVPPGEALQLLRGKHPHFAVRVREVACAPIPGLPRVNTRFYYLAFRDGLPSTTEFIQYLKDQLVYFCIPRKERVQAEQAIVADASEMWRLIPRLYEKAKNLFIEAKKGEDRSGEPGELTLFVLMEWALHATQIVSKMYLKTNRNMPVHGTDGIHARLDHGNLVLFFGESKLHDDFSRGLSSALASVKGTHSQYSSGARELDLVRDHHSFGPDDEGLVKALLEYLDYRSPRSNQYSRSFACLVGFSFNAYEGLPSLQSEQVESEFIKMCEQRIATALSLIGEKIKAESLEPLNFQFFLMPFKSVSELRSSFYAITGIT